MEHVELTAPGLALRPWRPADAPAVLAAVTDPAIAQWNPQDVTDEAGAVEWIRHRTDWSAGTAISLAVTDAADGALLGGIALHRIRGEDAEIGYWTAAPARGRNVAARAVTALTGWGFTRLGLHRVELLHAVPNVASCRVAERAGYAAEGLLRESYRFGDGRRYDEHLHARLATDPPPPGQATSG
ncbi:GNAT family N-acetyltransferase [Micromonospora sp. NPDC050686]|uniref:GNAT family N-acetyltransferase n=1 Tax=Micromonospora sp. NPDC050686 TaxID=3154631 RepID=UPI0033C97666